MCRTALFSLLLFLPLAGGAEPRAYYGEKGRGWFWKETPPFINPAPPASPPARALPAAPAPSVTPPPLSAAWFRQELGRFRDAALDQASEEDVLRYFRLQRLLMDKAERFSETARRLVLRHPELDENRRHPLAPFAKEAEEVLRDRARQSILKALSQRTGLLLLHRSDCPYCLKMAPLLEGLGHDSGLRLYALSLDGPPLRGLYSARPLSLAALPRGIAPMATPALYLMVPGRGFEPVAEGALSLHALVERLAEVGTALGLIPSALAEQFHGGKVASSGGLEALILQDLASMEGHP